MSHRITALACAEVFERCLLGLFGMVQMSKITVRSYKARLPAGLVTMSGRSRDHL